MLRIQRRALAAFALVGSIVVAAGAPAAATTTTSYSFDKGSEATVQGLLQQQPCGWSELHFAFMNGTVRDETGFQRTGLTVSGYFSKYDYCTPSASFLYYSQGVTPVDGSFTFNLARGTAQVDGTAMLTAVGFADPVQVTFHVTFTGTGPISSGRTVSSWRNEYGSGTDVSNDRNRNADATGSVVVDGGPSADLPFGDTYATLRSVTSSSHTVTWNIP